MQASFFCLKLCFFFFFLVKARESVTHMCIALGFRLFALSVAGEVMQRSVLHQSSKGEDEADRDK